MIDEFLDWFFDKLFEVCESIKDAFIVISMIAFSIITLPIWLFPFIFYYFFISEKEDKHVSKKTNAECIRSMTDEELAKFISGISEHCLAWIRNVDCSENMDCRDCKCIVTKWLQKEVEE